jgi:dTDP-4-dehydrorhamnose 3,5-epimerase-like enzyme
MITEVKNSDKGTLIAINDFSIIPFKPKRLFYIEGVPHGETRGNHAHREGLQMLWCLSGIIAVATIERKEQSFYELEPGEAIFIDKMVWSIQTYYKNARALVLCSNTYDESDYIRDWSTFKTWQRT